MTAGIYLHIPFCKVKCIYCDFYSLPKREDDIPTFTQTLIQEIEHYANSHDTEWEFDTIFFGGGTPSLLDGHALSAILETLHTNFNLSSIKEVTLESNPGEAPLEKLKDFRSLGINRLSIGFQSFDQNHLTFMGRIHSPEDCINTFDNARKAGFDNINTDLIFDIPDQTLDRWKIDLQTVVDLQPEHISAYSLTVEENTPLFELVKSGKVSLPSESIDIAMFEHSRYFLSSNGYEQYEISNYAKTGFQCQHNLHYWNRNPYLAFGPSAHGFDGKTRFWNVCSLDEYLHRVKSKTSPIFGNERLSQIDHFNEIIFNGLRLSEGVHLKLLAQYCNESLEDYLKKATQKWDGLIIENKRLKLISDKINLADEIASDLFLTATNKQEIKI